MAEPKICRNCIHKNVCEMCKTLELKDAIMIFDFECEQFLSADVVEVVRCKDCTEFDKDEGECSHWYGFRENDYCSYGTQKERGGEK